MRNELEDLSRINLMPSSISNNLHANMLFGNDEYRNSRLTNTSHVHFSVTKYVRHGIISSILSTRLISENLL